VRQVLLAERARERRREASRQTQVYLADIDAGMREQRRLQALLDKVRARRAAFEAEAKARAEADAVEDAPKAGAGASAAQPPVRHFAVGTAGVRAAAGRHSPARRKQRRRNLKAKSMAQKREKKHQRNMLAQKLRRQQARQHYRRNNNIQRRNQNGSRGRK